MNDEQAREHESTKTYTTYTYYIQQRRDCSRHSNGLTWRVSSKGRVRKWEFSHLHQYEWYEYVVMCLDSHQIETCWCDAHVRLFPSTVISSLSFTLVVSNKAHTRTHSNIMRLKYKWNIVATCNWRCSSDGGGDVATRPLLVLNIYIFATIHSTFSREAREEYSDEKNEKMSACSFCFTIYTISHYFVLPSRSQWMKFCGKIQVNFASVPDRHMVFFLLAILQGCSNTALLKKRTHSFGYLLNSSSRPLQLHYFDYLASCTRHEPTHILGIQQYNMYAK